MNSTVNKKGHGRHYGLRVAAYSLYAGFNGVQTICIAYLSFYMTNSLFISALAAGVVVALAKVFDGFSDVAAGLIIDRTHTKWGKARPYALVGVLMWAAIVALFSAVPTWSNGLKCIYVFVMYVLTDSVFKTLVSAADPVHYRHGFNIKEQMDSVAIWGTFGGLFAVVAGILLPTMIASYAVIEHGWTIIMLILAIPGAIFSLMKFFFIPETENPDEPEEAEKPEGPRMSVGDSLKYLFRNKYIFIYGIAVGDRSSVDVIPADLLFHLCDRGSE